MTEKNWTEEEKRAWLAAHGQGATHVVTFEPMYQIELCIPPWEHPDRQIARSAVAWGQSMSRVFADDHDGAPVVVAAHHEGNSLEIHSSVTAPAPTAPDRDAGQALGFSPDAAAARICSRRSIIAMRSWPMLSSSRSAICSGVQRPSAHMARTSVGWFQTAILEPTTV